MFRRLLSLFSVLVIVITGMIILRSLFFVPGGAAIHEPERHGPFYRLENAWVDWLALSPNGKFLACIFIVRGERGRICVFETATRKLLYTIEHPRKDCGFRNVVFGKDNNVFACYCDDECIQIRDVRTGRCLRTIREAVFGFENFENGTFLVGSDRRLPFLLRLWDWRDPRHKLELQLDEPSKPESHEEYALAFSPDEKLVATSGWQAPFDLWDAATGKRVRRLTGPDPRIDRLAFSPDGKILAAAAHTEEQRQEPWGDTFFEVVESYIALWDVQEGVVQRRLVLPRHDPNQAYRIYGLHFSPDGKTLACCRCGSLYRFDVETGKALPTIKEPEPDSGFRCFAFTPDSKRLYSGETAGIRLWDLATGAEIKFQR